MKTFLKTALCALAVTVAGTAAMAEQFDDGLAPNYYASMKDKKVIFLPLSMSFDLAQVWAKGMEIQSRRVGYDFSIRDPNWAGDVGAQALTTMIGEKPDLIVVQNPDMQVYSRLLVRAQKEGIKVIQINLKSTATTDAYVGANWYDIGALQAKMAVEACSPANGGSGKIAIMQGVPTNPNSYVAVSAIEDVLKDHPDMAIVSNQSADWDATKAHAVASTVLKQNADLCAYIGLWEVMDAGVAAAIREAGKQDTVKLFTNGGGQKPGCDAVANGTFAGLVSYDARSQARDLTVAIVQVMQQGEDVTNTPYAVYTPNRVITKENLTGNSCWTLDDVSSSPF